MLPISQNGYTYVHANPVNKVDPRGLCAEVGDELCWSIYERLVRTHPELAEIPVVAMMPEPQLRQLEQTYGSFPTEGYIHTQNYGSFDLKHVGVRKYQDWILANVQRASIWPPGTKYMFRVGPQGLLPGGDSLKRLAVYEAWYWVSGDIEPEHVNGVALAIFMDFERRWESWQWNSLIGVPSSYASEDLPSDYLGFFLASQGFTNADPKSLAVGFALLGCYEHNHEATPWFALYVRDSGPPYLWWRRNYQFRPVVERKDESTGFNVRQNVDWPPVMQIDLIPGTSGLWGFVHDMSTGRLGGHINVP